jgi:hypothetical protein
MDEGTFCLWVVRVREAARHSFEPSARGSIPRRHGLLHGGFRAASQYGDEAPEIGQRLLTAIDVTGARPIHDEEMI